MAQAIRNTLIDNFGRPISGASIAVYKKGTTDLASLYSDYELTATVGNPITSEADGSFLAFVSNGIYNIVPSKTGVTFDSTDLVGMVVFDPFITRSVAASTSLLEKDYVLSVDASGGAAVISLPALASIPQGKSFVVFKADTSVNSVTLDPDGAETINGGSTLVISASKQGIVFAKVGSEWQTYLPPAQTTSGVGKIPLGRSSDGKLEADWGGVALSLASLDANNRLVQTANTVWGGSAAHSLSVSPLANSILLSGAALPLDRGWFPAFANVEVFRALTGVFTVTIASPAVFTKTAHGLIAGDRIRLTTTGALPTGLAINMDYYVIAAGLTADAFEVSTVKGGSAANTSGTQSGTHTLTPTWTTTSAIEGAVALAIGGGGGGGGAQDSTAQGCGGGGGAAGQVKFNRIFPAASTAYSVTVGVGGNGGAGTGGNGSASNGSNGGATSVGALVSVSGGNGGQGGQNPNPCIGGVGGLGQQSLGGAAQGGAGVAGVTITTFTSGGAGGAGGTGSSGGGGGGGINPINLVGADGGSAGTNGQNAVNNAGNGGGGGGGINTDTIGGSGGNGGSGFVVIWWW